MLVTAEERGGEEREMKQFLWSLVSLDGPEDLSTTNSAIPRHMSNTPFPSILFGPIQPLP